MKIISFIICVFILNFVHSDLSAQKWEWVKQTGNNIVGNDSPKKMQLDSEGNICLVGLVKGYNTFGESGSDTTLPAYGTHDIYLQKFDSLGIHQWVRRHGSTGTDQATGLSIDSIGNWFLSGTFSATCNFSDTSLTSLGNKDCYVMSVNTNGEFRWIFSFGGVGLDQCWSIAGDAIGNSYVTGEFSDTLYFGNEYIISEGGLDVFQAKIDPNGNPIWIKGHGGDLDDVGGGIAINDDEIYIAGRIKSTAFFDSIAVTVNGSAPNYSDAFLCKTDSLGNVEWVVNDGGSSNDSGGRVDVDEDGNILFGGKYRGTSYFGSENEVISISNGQDDVFISYYQPNGILIKTLSFGGIGNDQVHTISYDESIDKVLVGGLFEDTVQFQGVEFASEGPKDMFMIQFDDTLGLEWKKQIFGDPYGGKEPNFAGMEANSAGDVFVAGAFLTPVYFDTILLTPHPINADIFYGKLRPKVKAGLFVNDNQLCENDSLQFMNNSTYNANEFAWQFEGGTPSTSNEENPIISYNQSGIFDVSLIVSGDEQSDTIYFNSFVNTITLPFIELGEDTAMCEGESIILDAGSHFSYYWNTNEETQTIIVDTASLYTVVVNNSFGCSSIDSIDVMVYDLPFVSLGNDTTLCEEEVLTLTVSTDFISILWNTGDTTESIEVDSSGVYSVLVQDLNLCYNSDEIQVYYEFCIGINESEPLYSLSIYPNPTIGQFSIECDQELDRISVFDQRGKQVFSQSNINSQIYSCDLSSLTKGLYYIEVVTRENSVIREKVILLD